MVFLNIYKCAKNVQTMRIFVNLVTYSYEYVATYIILLLLRKQQMMIEITDTMIITTIIPPMAAPAITATLLSPKILHN